MSSPLTIGTVNDLDALRADWSRLAEASGNVFSTWEWVDCWRRHIGRARTAVGVARRDDGSVAAILPLYTARRVPIRLVRFMGVGPSDDSARCRLPEDRAVAVDALRPHVEQTLGGSGLFLGERLWGEDWPWASLGGETVHHASSPVLTMSGRTFDEFLAGRSRNFREQVRRRERALARQHRVAFRLTETPEELEPDLSTLMRLHEARWAEGGSDAFTPQQRAFHQDFAAHAMRRGWLRLWTMEVDGRPAAAWYGLRFSGADFYYGRPRSRLRPAERRLRPALPHGQSRLEDGMREYRFGRGHEPYKSRFADHDPGLAAIAIAAGATGAVAGLAALRQALRMPITVRRRIIASS